MRLGSACTAMIALAACSALAVPAVAQGPGGGGFGANLPPEMQAKFKAMQKFRESHKNYQAIMQTIAGIQECEKDPKTQLNKDQAKKVLAVVKQWETKPVMSNEQAGQVNKQLTAGLNMAQIKAVATAPPIMGRRGGPGGGAGGGGPRPGGPGGPGGMANFKIPDPKEYNPLNPDTFPFEQARPRVKQRLADFKAKLEAAK